MLKHNQDGAANGMLISLIFAILLLIGALAFGGWAYNGRQDYKNNVDAKIATAVTAAKQQQGQADGAKFAEEAKNPLRTYQGPEAYGSLSISYPKTWSAYVAIVGANSNLSNGALLDGYFAPGTVPSITDQNSIFALRVQVISQTYAQVLQTLSHLNTSQATKAAFSAYALPKLPNIVGTKAVGQLTDNTQGSPSTTMIILPLRSNTLEISTQGTQYLPDFNNNILPNFSFSP